jgi:hypothetical protein
MPSTAPESFVGLEASDITQNEVASLPGRRPIATI